MNVILGIIGFIFVVFVFIIYSCLIIAKKSDNQFYDKNEEYYER